MALLQLLIVRLGFLKDGDDGIGVISEFKTMSHGTLFSLSIHRDEEP
jgi:hypothetical protein